MKNIITSFLKISATLKRSNRVIDIVNTLASAKSVIIFMPDKLEHFGIALQFIKDIKNIFAKANLMFFTRKSYQNLLQANQQHGIIFVTSDDVNHLGLPKKKLQQKIVATKYDVAIDLNDDFHFLSTYLCQKSSASLKICLDNSDREPFYNFCFRTDVQKNLEEKYRRLMMFLGSC